MRALHEGASVSIGMGDTALSLAIGNPNSSEAEFTKAFLQKLRAALSEDEFVKTIGLSLGELEKEYPKIMDEFPAGAGKVYPGYIYKNRFSSDGGRFWRARVHRWEDRPLTGATVFLCYPPER
ncbi:MAG: hypothetical protein ACXV5N_12465 [Halobacteriota archaeon]